MSDIWKNERGGYDIPSYSAVALKQKEELILRANSVDPLLEGVELTSGDPDFHKFAPLAEEVFGPGPFSRIFLRADPWTSPGSWRIGADNTERNIGMSLVKKHLGGEPA